MLTLAPAARSAVLPVLAGLRHDLGKYVSLQVRSLPPEPTDDELRAALIADLLQTRRGPSGSVGALDLWDPVLPALVGEQALADGVSADLRGHPAFERLRDAMDQLRVVVPTLARADRATLVRAAAAARAASDAVRELHRAVRGD